MGQAYVRGEDVSSTPSVVMFREFVKKIPCNHIININI